MLFFRLLLIYNSTVHSLSLCLFVCRSCRSLFRSVYCMSIYSLLFVFIICATSGYYLYLHSKHSHYWVCVFVRSEYATDGIKEWQKWTSTESAWFTWPADKKISSFILFVQFTGQFIHYHQIFMVYSKYTLYALSFIVSQFEEFKKQNYMFWELNWIKRWNEIIYYSTKRE